jgi:small-conductance mechanosensitive channel
LISISQQDASKEIEQAKDELRAHTTTQQKWVEDIKKRMQTDLPEQIVGDLQYDGSYVFGKWN